VRQHGRGGGVELLGGDGCREEQEEEEGEEELSGCHVVKVVSCEG